MFYCNLATGTDTGVLPTFTWGSGNSNDGFEMTIEFNDGGNSDVALLKKSSLQDGALPSFGDCILFGSLRKEEDAYMSVNGCPGNNTFEVTQNNYLCEITTTLSLNTSLMQFQSFELL